MYRYLYGPVPSRRLGRSLGVDLVPRKTCSFDCLFCQVGRTSNRTLKRREYVPVADVIAEIDSWLGNGGNADYITLSGSGEPTLHSRFGDVLDAVHKRCSIKIALLTNSSLLYLPEVRTAAAKANVVKVSLSAWNQTSFKDINRPHPELTLKKIIEGLCAFRAEYDGELWLEVFVLSRVNARIETMKKIARLAKSVRPDRIHLNTATRPPAEHAAIPVSTITLEKFAPLFNPPATPCAALPARSTSCSDVGGRAGPPAEVIGEFDSRPSTDWKVNEDEILAMLGRRPCTAEDIDAAFGMHSNEAAKYLGKLMSTGKVYQEQRGDCLYYLKADNEQRTTDN